MIEEFFSVSPLKILEKASRKNLGPGNLGALLAWAGIGKTTCLIHIALDKIFNHKKLVHISLEEAPEKVTSYYNVICRDLMKGLRLEEKYRELVDRNRMILAYLNRSFEIERLQGNLQNLVEKLAFKPDALIVDGLDFERVERGLFEALKELAKAFEVEIWLSALTHRHIATVNERGIPYPCDQIDDLFSIILQLQPESRGILLKLLKDHDHPMISRASIRLEPNTCLALEGE